MENTGSSYPQREHVVCHLPDKTKCVLCFTFIKSFTATSYSRCHAIKSILRSVRVACPNTIHGCTTGQRLYHEKVPPSKADCGGTAARVVKMGPCGRNDGDARDMDARDVDRIIEVVVFHRDAVDAMIVRYEQDGRDMETDPSWGVAFGAPRSEIRLETDEYLTAAKGYVGNYKDMFIVRSLTFVSNRRTYGPYGKEEGEAFEFHDAGGKIVGFHGRSGNYLDALGTYVR
ncbi:unnamed protein product [Alopecurus aequalis]